MRDWTPGWKYTLQATLSNTDFTWFWRPRLSRVSGGEYWLRWGYALVTSKVWRKP